MPYINVYVTPVLDKAIREAAEAGGKEWTRSKWLRRLAQRELAPKSRKDLLKFIRSRVGK